MVPDDCECIEDLNADGFVDLLDVVVILGQWMTSPDGLPDINGDGMVELQDLLMLLDAYDRVSLGNLPLGFFLTFFRAKMFYAPIRGRP